MGPGDMSATAERPPTRAHLYRDHIPNACFSHSTVPAFICGGSSSFSPPVCPVRTMCPDPVRDTHSVQCHERMSLLSREHCSVWSKVLIRKGYSKRQEQHSLKPSGNRIIAAIPRHSLQKVTYYKVLELKFWPRTHFLLHMLNSSIKALR